MEYFTKDTTSYEGLLQGDLFRVNHRNESPFLIHEEYALLITADCDMANASKNVSYLTFLPIISTTNYLESIWIPEFIDRLIKEISRELCVYIKKQKIYEAYSCNQMEEQQMIQWIKESSIEDVIVSLSLDKQDRKIKQYLELEREFKDGCSISNYLKIKELKNTKSKSIFGELKSSISNSKSEYYQLPIIDSMYDSSGIIKLRMIRPMHKSYVFTNEVDARQSKYSSSTNLVRIGRCSDYLRYSISQNFASLFSRIGMPSNFEEDINESTALFLEQLESNKND